MITLAWADMEKYTNGIDVFSNDYIPENEDVSLRMTFDNTIDLKHEWDKISDWPVSMWYWVLVDDNDLICSGACDPTDLEEIIIPWFGLESILENEGRFKMIDIEPRCKRKISIGGLISLVLDNYLPIEIREYEGLEPTGRKWTSKEHNIDFSQVPNALWKSDVMDIMFYYDKVIISVQAVKE